MSNFGKPKVMMVVEPGTGGTARHVAELAYGCQVRGFDVHLVCALNRDTVFKNALIEFCKVGGVVDEIDIRREISPARDAAAAIRLRQVIADVSPDLLHLHSSKAGALGRAAAAGLGRRRPAVIYTPHAYAFLAQPGSFKRLAYRYAERVLMPLTDCVAAVSEGEGRAASQLGGNTRVVVIPNGVDIKLVGPQKPLSNKTFTVGWLGRMTWQKDLGSAIKASSVLSRIGVAHELLIGGDGPERENAADMARRLGAEKWARFLGFISDTDTFYKRIDLLLITSRSEGMPYTGLDAIARGIPIVGFDVPGVRDIVTHGISGLLAEPGDPGALAAHMARLARDTALRRAMGRAARQRVAKTFTLEEQVRKFCGLYRSLMSKRPEPRVT